jgi:hypothetical protein
VFILLEVVVEFVVEVLERRILVGEGLLRGEWLVVTEVVVVGIVAGTDRAGGRGGGSARPGNPTDGLPAAHGTRVLGRRND